MQPGTHISDRELMMAVDGELPGRLIVQVEAHLAACLSCRTHARDLTDAIAEFSPLHYSSAPEFPSASVPRAQLRARLAALANEPVRPYAAAWHAWAGTAAAAVVLLAGLTTLPGILQQRQEAAGMIPNTRLTPGAVVSTDERNVCSGQLAGSARIIPAAMGQRVFEEYGIRSPQPREYELDYLIAPELGGSDDIRNVWPQPYSAAKWNSHLKDALEGRLRELVCSGRIPLATAQHDIASNWVAAYKKYFQTGSPLPDHYAFAKDMPWIE